MPRTRAGELYLGKDKHGFDITIETERHAITIAGSGSGKGVALVIPNLKRWQGNALVIDPKGENVEATIADRQKMGQRVHVLDPFGVTDLPNSPVSHEAETAVESLIANAAKYHAGNLPAKKPAENLPQIDWFGTGEIIDTPPPEPAPIVRRESSNTATYNPLDMLDPDSLTIKEDIEVISDGIVKREGENAGHWDDGAQALISGLIAYVLVRRTGTERSLPEVRRILRNDDKFDKAISEMATMEDCGGLCEDAHGAAYAKEGGYFVSNARKNTRWLDSKPIAESLSSSSFSLSELKTGHADVFLVLPEKYIAPHGRFLRLFVRCAINAMTERVGNGQLKGRQCLFFLDEFFTLGYIDEIAKAAGLMRGYGLQLWPILQDIGQLRKLYGRDGAETFFGNSDAHIFFGNTDMETLEYISKANGVFTEADINFPDPTDKDHFGFEEPKLPILGGIGVHEDDWQRYRREEHERQKNAWAVNQENRLRVHQEAMQKAMSKIGKPRLPVDEVRALVAKKAPTLPSERMLVFSNTAKPMEVYLAPYFDPELNLTWLKRQREQARLQTEREAEQAALLARPKTKVEKVVGAAKTADLFVDRVFTEIETLIEDAFELAGVVVRYGLLIAMSLFFLGIIGGFGYLALTSLSDGTGVGGAVVFGVLACITLGIYTRCLNAINERPLF